MGRYSDSDDDRKKRKKKKRKRSRSRLGGAMDTVPGHADKSIADEATEQQTYEKVNDGYATGLGSYIQNISFSDTWLRELELKTPGYILRVLLKDRSKFRETLKIHDRSIINNLIRVVSKAITCDAMHEQMNEIISIMKNANFFETSIPYFMQIPSDASRQAEMDFVNTIKNMISLISEILDRTPTSIIQLVGIHDCLQDTITGLRETSILVDDTLYTTFAQFTERKDKLMAARLLRQHTLNDTEKPPCDFREIVIFPQITDIQTNEEPFLRVNKDKGPYEDTDHYLDVQFRLLREDFIGPLRNGVAEYLQNQHGLHGRSKTIQDIRVYHDVRIIRPKSSDRGICYILQIDRRQLGKVKWESSKRLIYGSLVCLSPDNFRTIYCATVQNWEPRDIRFEYLSVKFQHDHSIIRSLNDGVFIMAEETAAYFESYCHVLAGLQSTRSDELPFEQYVVKCESQVSAPSYLQGNSVFDILPLVDENFRLKACSKLGIVHDKSRRNQQRKDTFSETSTRPVFIDVLKRDEWRSAPFLHLDGPQLDAIYTALTKEFVITQGPPGTGKTYIGLKIVKTLLHNISNWSKHAVTGDSDHRPMLIVCYTNHALDQFLEGIVDFFKGDILRIGGRSKSKLLEKCNLRTVRQNIRNSYRRRENMISGVSRDTVAKRHTTKRYIDELGPRLERELERLSRKMQISNTTILHEYILAQYMGAAYHRLVKPFEYWGNENNVIENSEYSVIAEWLGTGSLMFVQTMPVTDYAEEHHGDTLVNDRFISVVDETDALQAQRTVDVDDSDDDTTSGTGDPCTAQERHIHSSNSNVDGHRNDIETGWISDKESIKSMRKHFRKQMASEDVMIEDANRDLWRISIDERWRIYRQWVQEYDQDCLNQIAIHENEYEKSAEQYQLALLEENKQLMKMATVIGMTTSGAARYQSVLKEIRPRIIVVEEAAEVFEAHIMATVTKGCEHLIMIGDHKQLKPNPAFYKLATDYKLDISLFERMVRNGLPCDCLELQHRMRPEIACLMNHIYENLRDHDDVKTYENIKGISNNIFCIDHNIPETRNKDIRSHLNEFEADYIVSLCKYLLLQGYTSSQITVLTMYSGQMFCLRNRMPKTEFDGVVVTTVDDYQGVENDIILLSLVRSNIEGNIGFLKIKNRVCVALSRAKKGLYIVGNFDCMSKQSALWKAIRKDMQHKSLIGEGLHLYCQNHPTDDGIFARVAGDFTCAPEGWCENDCDARLRCGHVCRLRCGHVVDSEHEQYKCMEDFLTVCTNNHECVKRCHQKCDTCSVVVSKIMPRCDHTQQVECGVDPSDFICKDVCQTVLQCGHKCQADCGEDHTPQCQVKLVRIWPCGHKTMVHCYRRNRDEDCHFPCNMRISCGHKCSGNCSMCFEGRLHRPCQNKCKRVMVCGHECNDKCGSCTQCTRKCENECIHRMCGRRCGDACLTCMEPCTWRCTHYQCRRLCSEPCLRPRCDKACNKTLPCGHKCIGLCGEHCPLLCKICDRENISRLVWHDGDINIQSARFIQLQDCNHIMEYKSMDRYMDANVKLGDESVHAVELKVCPQCKTKIRKCSRYGNIINSTLHDIEAVKKGMLVKPSAIHELKESIQKDSRHIAVSNIEYTQMALAIESYRNYISKEQGLNERVLRLKLIELQLIDLLHKLTLAATENIYTIYQESHTLSKIIKWIVDDRGSMTTDTVNDVKREISRYAAQETLAICKRMQTKYTNSVKLDEEMGDEITFADRIIADGKELGANIERMVKFTSEKAAMLLNVHDVYSLIDKTFTNIVAVDATNGNWRMCRKGHLFEIADECVGSYEGSTCRRCAETEGAGCRRKTFPATCRHPGSTDSSGHRGRDLTDSNTMKGVRDKLQTDRNAYDDVIATPISQPVKGSQRTYKHVHENRPYSHDHRRVPDQAKSLHSQADLRLLLNATRHKSNTCQDTSNTFENDSRRRSSPNRETVDSVEKPERVLQAEATRETRDDVGNKPILYINVSITNDDILRNDNTRICRNEIICRENTKMDTRDKTGCNNPV